MSIRNRCGAHLSVMCIACGALTAAAQGSFQNLDFEDANVDPVPPGQSGGIVAISNGLPGWTGYIGTDQVAFVRHNDSSLGAPSMSILGPSSGAVIEGFYTALLQPGVIPPSPPQSASLAQTGLVPASAKSMFFKGNGVFSVSLAGQIIPFYSVGSGPNYVLYDGDISQFAGQSAELRFTVFPPAGSPNGTAYLDSIEFSSQAIPEPGGAALVVLGLGVSVFAKALRRDKLAVRTVSKKEE